MNYRAEIDGLRAVAVLPVVLFHAGIGLFSGGFVGVDVFFVISGYLITNLIIEDLSRGSFSFKEFYMRRARRILPALFVVMLATIPIAYKIMLPSQYLDFSQSLLAAVGFVSNILFWRESDYFAADASEKPLLHTWSLSVEEQFYLIIPCILLVTWHLNRRVVFWVAVAAAILSLAVCEYASRVSYSANFYLIPTRAWELLAGVICALLQHRQGLRSHGAAGLMGLVMIIASVFLLDSQMRMPSLYSVLPVAGTMLVLLYARSGTFAARMLAVRPLVAIGLVSYSLYLWHHPIIAFVRIHGEMMLDAGVVCMILIASLSCSILSWRYIEQPFRNRHHRLYISTYPCILLLSAAAISIVLLGLFGISSHGHQDAWMKRANESQLRAYQLIEEAKQQPRFYDNGDCIFNVATLNEETKKRIQACKAKYGKGVAIIGDSHSINLFYALIVKPGKRRFIVALSQAMCRPHDNNLKCYYDDWYEFLKESPDILSDVVYKQAGFYLMTDLRGKPLRRSDMDSLPLQAPVPDYMPNTKRIEGVLSYLNSLAPYARITWFGPRIEPHIRETLMVRKGCDAVFSLRPNQQKNFERLDAAIADLVSGSAVRYQSRIYFKTFDMAYEFMNCDTAYFKDGDHYSASGENYFGQWVTLDALLRDGGKQ